MIYLAFSHNYKLCIYTIKHTLAKSFWVIVSSEMPQTVFSIFHFLAMNYEYIYETVEYICGEWYIIGIEGFKK